MPTILKEFEFKAAATFGHAKYDWDQLLDGQIYKLTKGVDFDCKPLTMAMLIRKNAERRNVKVRISRDGDTMVIQQYGPAEPKEPKTEGEKAPAPVAQKPTPAAPAPAPAPKAPAPQSKPAAPAPKAKAK